MAVTPKRQKAETYRNDEEALLRPDVGTQAQFCTIEGAEDLPV